MAYKDSLIPGPLDDGKQKEKKHILSERISPVDFDNINDVGDLVESFQSASIQARNLGQCAQIFGKMLQDKERPTIMLGLAGPLIAAGLRKVIRDMVHYNMVDVIVSTGAVLYQDYYNALGGGHYYGSPTADDTKLRELFINRIYDTYVDEELFCEDDTLIGKFADKLEPRNYSSREFISLLSETIDDEESILVMARKNNIPIFCRTSGGNFRPGRTAVAGGPYVAKIRSRQLRPVCRGGDSPPIFNRTNGGIFRPVRTGVVGGPYVATFHSRRQLRPVCR